MRMINSEKLIRLRKEKCITQKKLAFLCKISIDEISLIERHKKRLNPCIEIIQKLANYYDISIDWLCDRDNISYLSPLEKKVIMTLRKDYESASILQSVLQHYENPTELTTLLREVRLMTPKLDLDTAKAVYKLLTSKIEM